MSGNDENGHFDEAAQRVVARLVRADWFRGLAVTAIPMLLALAAIAGLLAWSGAYWLLAVGWGVLAAWLATTGAWAWRARPTPAVALARWDEAAGRDEMFVSAWCFEREGALDAGQRLHVAAARRRLSRDLPHLAAHLPAPLAARVVASPLLGAAALVASAVLAALWADWALASEDRPLDDAAIAQARQEGREIEEAQRTLDDLDGLTDEQQEQIDRLKDALAESAEKLEMLQDETPRDVLSELEDRARMAEALAEALEGTAAEQLSGDLLAELERHADTADLAAALRADDLARVAEEAERIAERLQGEDLTIEQRERLEHALVASLAAASPADLSSTLGRHLQGAAQELQAGRPRGAAEAFARLAEHYRQAAQRRNAQQQLQELAQALRRSGQRITGSCQGNLQRLAQSCPGGMCSLGTRPLGPISFGMFRPGRSGQPRLGMRIGMSPVPGRGRGPGGQGAGLAPVPGRAGPQTGGLFAGRGSAQYGDQRTTLLSDSSTDVVDAQIGADGASEAQQIEGSQHQEDTARQAQQLALAAIQAEEEALAAEPLPPSRRDQVLRYFTALRNQLEQQP